MPINSNEIVEVFSTDSTGTTRRYTLPIERDWKGEPKYFHEYWSTDVEPQIIRNKDYEPPPYLVVPGNGYRDIKVIRNPEFSYITEISSSTKKEVKEWKFVEELHGANYPKIIGVCLIVFLLAYFGCLWYFFPI